MSEQQQEANVYGFRLFTPFGIEHLSKRAPVRSWPSLQIIFDRSGDRLEDGWNDDAAVLTLADGLQVAVDRRDRCARLLTDRGVGDDAVVHPGLTAVAAAAAPWYGRVALHGGLVVLDDETAWGILGPKGGGKSTFLAALAADGFEVLADDLIVTDGAVAFAGPRVLDLRPEAASELDRGLVASGVPVRGGSRLRVTLPESAASAPLAGFVTLAWETAVAVRALPLSMRLGVLAEQLAIRTPDALPGELLGLLGLPVLRFERPKDFGRLGAGLETLRAALS